MSWARTITAMQALVLRFRIGGCALVDPATGWIWHSCGDKPLSPQTWEAAVDYWRLHERQRESFGGLGELSAVVLYHRDAVLAVLPCCSEPRLHMVCVADHGRVDWRAWQRAVRDFGQMLGATAAAPQRDVDRT